MAEHCEDADRGGKNYLIEVCFLRRRARAFKCNCMCRAVCKSKQEETSSGDGGCVETFHHSPAVLQEQMETCLWHVHMHACMRASTCA